MKEILEAVVVVVIGVFGGGLAGVFDRGTLFSIECASLPMFFFGRSTFSFLWVCVTGSGAKATWALVLDTGIAGVVAAGFKIEDGNCGT